MYPETPPSRPEKTASLWGFSHRVKAVMALLTLAWALLAMRVYVLQVLQGDMLAAIAQKQYQSTLEIKGRRGDILDRTGRKLAVSVPAASFFAYPPQVENPAATAKKLAPILGMSAQDLQQRLMSDRGFVWLKRQTLPQEALDVKALDLPGIGVTMEYRRAYPGRFSAAPVLGFTGVDNQGLEGLEYAYDSFLRGDQTFRVIDKDALGHTFILSSDAAPQGGGRLMLTLHPVVQTIAEEALERERKASQALRAMAIVMDSATGEILAMAHSPGFNANDYQHYDSDNYFNHVVTSGYEPGSTFKLITVAAALDQGLVQPDTLIFCENGQFQHYDSLIHDTASHGWLSLAQVVALSSNIGAAKVGLMLPPATFADTIRRFGFGTRPGLLAGPRGQRLGGEATGSLPDPKTWTAVDQAAISFGHGLLVSPLQLVAAVNVFAQDGKLLRPYLVRQIQNNRGQVIQQNNPQVVRQVISPATAHEVRAFMVQVVREGTGREAALKDFTVAGKTGTSEKYEFEARGYSKTRQIASFAGFVPAENPRLTLVILVEEPKGKRSGGTVAAPVFAEIARRALPALGVWPAEKIRHLRIDLPGNAR